MSKSPGRIPLLVPMLIVYTSLPPASTLAAAEWDTAVSASFQSGPKLELRNNRGHWLFFVAALVFGLVALGGFVVAVWMWLGQ